MKHSAPQKVSEQDSPQIPVGISSPYRGLSVFGTALLAAGTALAVLLFIDHWTSVRLDLPSFWYRTRGTHLVLCIALFVLGWQTLRNSSLAERHVSEGSAAPVFEQVTLFTKEDCSLCEQARTVLEQFRDFLPPVDVVNISQDARLQEAYKQWVPVVQIDGRIRFRGIVSEVLLQRLITARLRQRHSEAKSCLVPRRPEV